MSMEWAIQEKVFAALNDVISCPVYNMTPQKRPFPYVTIGQATNSVNDTDTTVNQNSVFSIHAWSQDTYSDKEVKQIQGEVFNALYLIQFLDDDYSFTKNTFLSSQIFIDSDGITRHGIQDFNLTIQRK